MERNYILTSDWFEYLEVDSSGAEGAIEDGNLSYDWIVYRTLSDVETDDEVTWDVEFEYGSDKDGEFSYRWMSGKKPNGFLRFVFWSFSGLAFAGIVGYYFMA